MLNNSFAAIFASLFLTRMLRFGPPPPPSSADLEEEIHIIAPKTQH